MWDNKANDVDHTYNAIQQLESLAWRRDGNEFISAHTDGSYVVWSASDSSAPKEASTTPYGKMHCNLFLPSSSSCIYYNSWPTPDIRES